MITIAGCGFIFHFWISFQLSCATKLKIHFCQIKRKRNVSEILNGAWRGFKGLSMNLNFTINRTKFITFLLHLIFILRIHDVFFSNILLFVNHASIHFTIIERLDFFPHFTCTLTCCTSKMKRNLLTI